MRKIRWLICGVSAAAFLALGGPVWAQVDSGSTVLMAYNHSGSVRHREELVWQPPQAPEDTLGLDGAGRRSRRIPLERQDHNGEPTHIFLLQRLPDMLRRDRLRVYGDDCLCDPY